MTTALVRAGLSAAGFVCIATRALAFAVGAATVS